jgi:ATP-dependent Clp protease adaptor protein ClpS
MAQHQEQYSESTDTIENKSASLILHNDFNTFEHVIQSLVSVLDFEPLQAEQCAFIVHYKGKCVVKNDNLEKVVHFHSILSTLGLTVSVEDQNGK